MQMCPYCNKVYDESEYVYCPYCSGELEEERGKIKIKTCPNCDGIMYWDENSEYWECSNCGDTIETDEDDYDDILEE